MSSTDEYGPQSLIARRDRKVRSREVLLWIAHVENAATEARRVSEGNTLDTPSSDVRRRRWQLTWDVADLWEWMHASDVGGLLWCADLFAATLGPDAFDLAQYESEMRALLSAADAHVERLRLEVLHRAAERPQAVPCDGLPDPDPGVARLLPGASGSRPEVVGGRRERSRRKAVASPAGGDPPARRVRVPVR